ncbi:hypothetical protein [Nocardiopsis potens]|uniref:hypothetical protein n=1 Tax=Nocardiopsis potens TaxID=1246458 RepID=UPI0003459007|nr:hypothetical protein [Nocardiopsis potens]
MRIAKAAAAGLLLLFAGGCATLTSAYPVFGPDTDVPDPAVLKEAFDGSADCTESATEEHTDLPVGTIGTGCSDLLAFDTSDITGDLAHAETFFKDVEEYGTIDEVAYEDYPPQTPVNDGWEEHQALRIGPRDALQTCDGFSTCATLVQFEAYSLVVEVETAEDVEYSDADLATLSEQVATALTEKWDAS